MNKFKMKYIIPIFLLNKTCPPPPHPLEKLTKSCHALEIICMRYKNSECSDINKSKQQNIRTKHTTTTFLLVTFLCLDLA